MMPFNGHFEGNNYWGFNSEDEIDYNLYLKLSYKYQLSGSMTTMTKDSAGNESISTITFSATRLQNK
jgi:hypothetical protein